MSGPMKRPKPWNNSQGKPGKPVLVRPDGSSQPPGMQPPPRQPAGRPSGKSGGSTTTIVVLSVIGAIALIVLLGCGGISWGLYRVYTTARQSAQQAHQTARAQAAQRNAQQRFGRRPPSRRSPSQPPVNSVQSSLEALDQHHRRREALTWLAGHDGSSSERAKVTAKLVPLLSDWGHRNQAQQALERWAKAETVPLLVQAAKSADARRDRDTQRAIVRVLAKVADDRAAPAMSDYLSSKHDTREALRALQSLGTKSASHLIPYLNDPDRRLRDEVRTALSQMKVESALLVGQSLEDLGSANTTQQREAAEYLAANNVDAKVQSAVASALVPLISNHHVRQSAMKALSRWATGDTVPDLIDAVAAADAKNDRSTQVTILKLLIELKDDRALDPIAQLMASRTNHDTARDGFRAFGAKSVPYILPFVSDPDFNSRRIARELLVELKVDTDVVAEQCQLDLQSDDRQRVLQTLQWLAQDEVQGGRHQAQLAESLENKLSDQEFRPHALRALRNWATRANVPALIDLLDDNSQRGVAAEILVKLKDPRAVEPLMREFATNFFRRGEATTHLIGMGPVAEPYVLSYLSHPDWQVQKAAIGILNRIGTKRSLPALQTIVARNSLLTKGDAQNAIKSIVEAGREAPPMEADDDDGGGRFVRSTKMRLWTVGSQSFEAQFIEFALGRVRLKTKEGRFLSFRIGELSPPDRDYVRTEINAGRD